MQKGKTLLLILAAVSGLAGCGQGSLPDVCSVSIGKDGGIAHQVVGNFDQNYYEMEGLETLASDRVSEYCADNGADKVSLTSAEEKGGKVLLQFQYATDQDYSDFNHREMFVGTVEEANGRGYKLDHVAFVSSGGEPVELGGISDSEKKQIVIIGTKPSEELVVNTYGRILYINQSADSDLDVSFSGKKGVHIVHQAGENADESVLSYIVFE